VEKTETKIKNLTRAGPSDGATCVGRNPSRSEREYSTHRLTPEVFNNGPHLASPIYLLLPPIGNKCRQFCTGLVQSLYYVPDSYFRSQGVLVFLFSFCFYFICFILYLYFYSYRHLKKFILEIEIKMYYLIKNIHTLYRKIKYLQL
jgi:hypothetical protein